MARVVICDSHSAIQAALEAKIAETGGIELLGTTSSVDELWDVLNRSAVDISILELTLPGAVGVDLIRNLRQRFENLRIIIYTMYEEAIYAARAIRAGASGYVMKRESTECVVHAIQAALRGNVFVSEQVEQQLSDGEDAMLHPTNALTDEQMAVFQLLGEGHPPEEISMRLAIPRRRIDEIQRLSIEKLRLDTREALVQYASRIVHQ